MMDRKRDFVTLDFIKELGNPAALFPAFPTLQYFTVFYINLNSPNVWNFFSLSVPVSLLIAGFKKPGRRGVGGRRSKRTDGLGVVVSHCYSCSSSVVNVSLLAYKQQQHIGYSGKCSSAYYASGNKSVLPPEWQQSSNRILKRRPVPLNDREIKPPQKYKRKI
jgi:hypothetical protein